MLFYGSTILYVATTIPLQYQHYVLCNPLAAIFSQMRHAIVDPDAPTIVDLMGWRALVPAGIIFVHLRVRRVVVPAREPARRREPVDGRRRIDRGRDRAPAGCWTPRDWQPVLLDRQASRGGPAPPGPSTAAESASVIPTSSLSPLMSVRRKVLAAAGRRRQPPPPPPAPPPPRRRRPTSLGRGRHAPAAAVRRRPARAGEQHAVRAHPGRRPGAARGADRRVARGPVREIWAAAQPHQKPRLAVLFSTYFQLPDAMAATGLLADQPPFEVHAMARGPLAAGGDLYISRHRPDLPRGGRDGAGAGRGGPGLRLLVGTRAARARRAASGPGADRLRPERPPRSSGRRSTCRWGASSSRRPTRRWSWATGRWTARSRSASGRTSTRARR